MNNIQFFHQNAHTTPYVNKQATYALDFEDFEAKDFIELLSSFNPNIELSFGIAKVSSKDQYNKKIGREVSMSKMKSTFFDVYRVEFDFDKERADINLEDKNTKIIITVGISKKSAKPRLINVIHPSHY